MGLLNVKVESPEVVQQRRVWCKWQHSFCMVVLVFHVEQKTVYRHNHSGDHKLPYVEPTQQATSP